MNRFLGYALLASILCLSSCQSDRKNQTNKEGAENSVAAEDSKDTLYKKGVCFDKVISPYVYQIASVEGEKIFYFALDKPSKEVLSATVEKLFQSEDPFKVVACP